MYVRFISRWNNFIADTFAVDYHANHFLYIWNRPVFERFFIGDCKCFVLRKFTAYLKYRIVLEYLTLYQKKFIVFYINVKMAINFLPAIFLLISWKLIFFFLVPQLHKFVSISLFNNFKSVINSFKILVNTQKLDFFI